MVTSKVIVTLFALELRSHHSQNRAMSMFEDQYGQKMSKKSAVIQMSKKSAVIQDFY